MLVLYSLLLNNDPLDAYILFMHSSLNRHLDCFCLLAIMNNVTMNTYEHFFFTWKYVFLSTAHWRAESLGQTCWVIVGRLLREVKSNDWGLHSQLSNGNETFNLWRKCQAVSQSSCTVLRSHQQWVRVPLSPPSWPTCVPSCPFDYSCLGGCEVVSHLVLIWRPIWRVLSTVVTHSGLGLKRSVWLRIHWWGRRGAE